MTISIRSSYVIDGGIVDLEIFPLQQAAAIDTIQNLAINGNMLDHQYTINWTNLNIPPGSIQFKVVATLRVPHTVSAPSDPLSVDLIAPLFSA